ncbi:MAG TPA: mycofactocin-coupled SDR family oxidoreductase [Chloroflexaceae bacterium]|nr:mycofactocin-coupled SDR family oxidoreductase [Chloroflexaceae bacterium]
MGMLDGKVALITGGARGQGRAHALAMAREGADLALCDLAAQLPSVPYPMATPADLAETARMVEGLGRRCVALTADVRSGEQMRAVAERCVGELGRLDILVANAGIESYGRAWELGDDQWDELVGVCLTGVWQSCKAAIPHMLGGGRGAIVITSSVAGLKGLANDAHYSAAKHGVVGLMRSLALELAPYSIRVNSVHPSSVNTPIIRNQATYTLFSGGRADATEAEVLPAFRALNLLPIPWMEPEDIAAAVLWLVSDEARYVTGVALPVDAGLLVK